MLTQVDSKHLLNVFFKKLNKVVLNGFKSNRVLKIIVKRKGKTLFQ
jgi:hypothetical protein